MKRIGTRWRSAALAVALIVTMSGCSAATVTVDSAHPAAGLSVGEVLSIDLGRVNPSIGDSWELTGAPDPAVLKTGSTGTDFGGGNPPPGSYGNQHSTFTAVGKGSTSLTYEYRYRGEKPADPTEQKTQTFQITVR